MHYRCLKNQTCTGDPSIQRVLQWPRIIVYVHVYMRIGMCIERSLYCRWWFQFDIFKWSNIIVHLFVSRCLFVSVTCGREVAGDMCHSSNFGQCSTVGTINDRVHTCIYSTYCWLTNVLDKSPVLRIHGCMHFLELLHVNLWHISPIDPRMQMCSYVFSFAIDQLIVERLWSFHAASLLWHWCFCFVVCDREASILEWSSNRGRYFWWHTAIFVLCHWWGGSLVHAFKTRTCAFSYPEQTKSPKK